MTQGRKYSRGFNLVEMAVVLGIIGLVTGGIWWGAAKMNERMQVNQNLTDLQYVLNRISGMVDTHQLGNISNGDVSPFYLFFPPGFKLFTGTGAIAYRPESKVSYSVAVSQNVLTMIMHYDYNLGVNPPVYRAAMPESVCMNMVSRAMMVLTDAAQAGSSNTVMLNTDAGMRSLSVTGKASLYGDWASADAQNVKSACAAGVHTLVTAGLKL